MDSRNPRHPRESWTHITHEPTHPRCPHHPHYLGGSKLKIVKKVIKKQNYLRANII